MTAKPKNAPKDAKPSKKQSQVQASLKTETPSPTKHPGGRPTDYKPEYCEQIIELGKLGYTVEKMASVMDLGKRTLYLWADTYPEFMHAFTRARDEALLFNEEFAEKYLVESPDGPRLNTNLYKFKMHRFQQYRDILKDTKTDLPQIVVNYPDGVKPQRKG